MPGKVLIADDSLSIQKQLTGLLKPAGIEVVTVSNGEHAVRKMASVQPDVVLADVFMPVRDGYEVCEYVKSSGEFPQTRVLLLVSKMEHYDDKKAALARADGKIDKPFEDPPAVLATIKQHVEKVLAMRPAPAAAPIDEFAAAVPTEEEVAAAATAPAPEPEPQFSTRPTAVSFEGAESTMGFADMVAEEAPPAPSSPPVPLVAAVSEVTASDEVMDLSQATMLTTADELQRRISEERPEGAAVEEPVAPAEVVSAPEAPPATEETPTVVATSYDTLMGKKPAEVEKPVLAEAWEMTGPQPGAPPVPVVGGFDSQWTSGGEEAAVAEAPAQEAVAPPAEAPPAAQPYAPEEFAAAMQAALESQPATPPEPEEPPPPAVAAPAPLADAYAGPPISALGVDPALVDEVVDRVLERLTPQVMDTIAREVVRPLAEALLKERLGR